MPKRARQFKRFRNPRSRTLEKFNPKKECNPLRLTPEYKDFRKIMLNENPICAKISCSKAATDIHHIERITKNPDRIFDPKNILCVCDDCHILIESAVNRGIDQKIWAELFEGLF